LFVDTKGASIYSSSAFDSYMDVLIEETV